MAKKTKFVAWFIIQIWSGRSSIRWVTGLVGHRFCDFRWSWADLFPGLQPNMPLTQRIALEGLYMVVESMLHARRRVGDNINRGIRRRKKRSNLNLNFRVKRERAVWSEYLAET